MPETDKYEFDKRIELDATDLGLVNVNLKSTTPVVGTIVDLSGFRDFILGLKAVAAGANGTVGTAKVQADFFDRFDNLIWSGDIWTGIGLPTVASTSTYILAFGTGEVAAASSGSAVVGANLFRAAGKVRFTLAATVASDVGTSCLGSLFLRGDT